MTLASTIAVQPLMPFPILESFKNPDLALFIQDRLDSDLAQFHGDEMKAFSQVMSIRGYCGIIEK